MYLCRSLLCQNLNFLVNLKFKQNIFDFEILVDNLESRIMMKVDNPLAMPFMMLYHLDRSSDPLFFYMSKSSLKLIHYCQKQVKKYSTSSKVLDLKNNVLSPSCIAANKESIYTAQMYLLRTSTKPICSIPFCPLKIINSDKIINAKVL